MKKILGFFLLAAVVVGCSQKGTEAGECVIMGTVADKALEGKRIFLVPMFGPQDAAHVDSVEIKDGKFEFHKDSVMMAKILMDYHYRFNTQTLLVVTDPGIVEVLIDTVSSAKGTPQNNVLQQWKDMTEVHNSQMGFMRRNMSEAKQKGDSLRMNTLKLRSDSIHIAYKQESRKLVAGLKDCVVKDFIAGMFPLTYKRKMPDGTIVEMDADTNEPVKK
ncbi:MAG: DUF4369 domain-containing protein [Prevotella sp.]|nr:DUF4369 domain-containing protein [Prevotella sp.]MBO5625388.1 DUF4369 domain-containing protein [Prevotella sp.]